VTALSKTSRFLFPWLHRGSAPFCAICTPHDVGFTLQICALSHTDEAANCYTDHKRSRNATKPVEDRLETCYLTLYERMCMTCSACEWRLTSGGVRSLIIS
jgi:hypothetical protein